MPEERKAQWEEFAASCRRHNILALYHATSVANLPSIVRAGGLLSRKRQNQEGYCPEKYHGWGNKWQDLEDYICLGFKPPRHLRDEKAPQAVLKISPDVILLEGTVFCPLNSARKWLSAAEIGARADLESFEVLFRHEHGSALKRRDSEILALDRIPLSLIERILFLDNTLRGKARWSCFRSAWGRFLRTPCLWFKFAPGADET